MPADIANIPKIIQSLRESRGLTRKQLADAAGRKSESNVYKWEVGQSLPTVEALLGICRALRVDLNVLLGYPLSELPNPHTYDVIPQDALVMARSRAGFTVRGMTQAAKVIGGTYGGAYENASTVSLAVLCSIADVLKTTPDDILLSVSVTPT